MDICIYLGFAIAALAVIGFKIFICYMVWDWLSGSNL